MTSIGRWVGLCAAFLVMCGMGATPPSLRVESQEVAHGVQEVRVPLTLKASGVAALQAELQYDAGQLQFRGAVESENVTRAEKQLTANGEHAGVIRLLLFGFNQNTLPEGSIASVVFARRESKTGTAPIAIKAVSATDAKGQAIVLQVVDGTITLH